MALRWHMQGLYNQHFRLSVCVNSVIRLGNEKIASTALRQYTHVHILFTRWLYSHASIAVAFSDLIILNMLIAGTQGP